MADIEMCANKHCILRETCYRSTAPVNRERQAWNIFDGPTLYDPEKKCEMYWKDEKLCEKIKRKP